MIIVARQTGSIWKISEENDNKILKNKDLITFLESKGYSINHEENSIIVSNVPKEDFLANIMNDFYGDLAEVYPF